MSSLSNNATNLSTAQLEWYGKTFSRALYPKTIKEVFIWAQLLWDHHGIYSQAISQAVRYFMTELEISGGEDLDARTCETYQDTIEENFDLLGEAGIIGDDYIGFGTSFSSVFSPIQRMLVCPVCGSRYALSHLFDTGKVSFDSDYQFRSYCSHEKCRTDRVFEVVDEKLPETSSKPVVIRWPPQLIEMIEHPLSKRAEYRLNIKDWDDFRLNLQRGHRLYLEDTPWDFIQAIRQGKQLVFDSDEIYRMTNPCVAVKLPLLKGWGLPKFMNEFETVILIAMLDRQIEAFLTDYLMPFRVIAPPAANATTVQAGNVLLGGAAAEFVAKVRTMLANHRRNPTGWNFLPYPVQYQALGGEAKNLTPTEMQEHYEMRLLRSMGIPQEFYSASLNNSAGPIIGFRMFERTWQHFAAELNKWITWVVRKQGELRRWEKVSARIVPVSVYEDPDVRNAKGELAGADQIPQSTYFRSIGLRWRYEKKQRIREKEQEAMMNEAAQRRADMRSANASNLAPQQPAPAGGAPAPAGPAPAPAGGGTGNPSLDEMQAQADQMAQQYFQGDPSQRRSSLTILKRQNPTLHALVTQSLQNLEQSAASQGVAMARTGQPLTGGQG